MTHEDPVLNEVVEAVWATVFGLPAAPVAAPREGGREGSLRASVDVSGEQVGRIVLECSAPMARAAASRMFGLGDEPPSAEDLADAVSELVNIIGGNVRGRVQSHGRLGLPVMPTEAGRGEPIWFESQGMSFAVTVERADGG